MTSRRSVGVTVLVLFATIHLSAQTWYQLYDEAIRDVDARRYQQAEKKLLDAKRAGPASGDRRFRYGQIFEHFFPEFFLGVIYLELGRDKEAIVQFNLARAANIEKARDPRFRQVGDLIKRAEARVVVVAENKPAENKPAENRPAENKPDPPAPPKPVPVPAPPSTAPKPVDPLESVRQRFAGLMNDARSQLSQRNFARADQLARSARTLAEQNNLGAQRAEADALLPQIEGAAAAGLNDALRRRDAPGARREYTALVTMLPAAAETYRVRVETLEGELARDRAQQLQRTAMVAFLDGNYAQTLTLLGDAEKLTPLTARGYFYRACSLAVSAITQGPVNAAQAKQLENDARRNYRIAARSRNEFKQDLQYVSPKIRQFLEAK